MFERILPLLVPLMFIGLIVLERVFPARQQPHVRFWLLKGVVFFLGISALNAIIPAAVMSIVQDRSVLHLGWLGTWGGAALLIVINDLVGYWTHRFVHTGAAWRFTHQLHHSAERMDMVGALYFHPFDLLVEGIIPGILITVLLGLSPMAAAVGGFLNFIFAVSPHLNVRTPAWLGYVFQRPEMHAVHHLRGVHAHNYGVLAVSDLLFGTWKNPASFPQEEFGFWDGASAELWPMLLCRDVSRPRPATRPIAS